ncbi:MAG TPA: hypothetical protein VIG42_01110 [Solirubrobacteraceae bacterium]|jgi:hypothetical protein
MQPLPDNQDQRPPLPPEPAGQIEAERLEAEEPLKCVWSGFPNYDRSCRSRIPASVVVKAWHREMQLNGTGEGFFYFSWRSGVWLAYGLRDGGVRGVYCPTHCSERDSREPQEEAADGDRPMGIALQ